MPNQLSHSRPLGRDRGSLICALFNYCIMSVLPRVRFSGGRGAAGASALIFVAVSVVSGSIYCRYTGSLIICVGVIFFNDW